ncbi:MAG: anti-sigma factor [Rubrivivax sp.]
MTVTDELLSAWLDGELKGPEHAAEHAAVEAWLREHPEDAARLRLWAADAEGLRARLAPVLDEPVPEGLRAVVARRPFVAARWAVAASAAGLLLLGGVLGAGLLWQWQQQPGAGARLALGAGSSGGGASGWVQRAAAAHAVYVPEPRHAVEVKAQEEHLARWLTRRIEVPVKLFDLHAQGFELVGGRLLPDGSGKSAQLMYQDPQGLRVTVYLRKPEVGTPAAFRYERQGELGLFYWVESGAGYALVGALPKEQLLALAQAIYSQGGGSGAASEPR